MAVAVAVAVGVTGFWLPRLGQFGGLFAFWQKSVVFGHVVSHWQQLVLW